MRDRREHWVLSPSNGCKEDKLNAHLWGEGGGEGGGPQSAEEGGRQGRGGVEIEGFCMLFLRRLLVSNTFIKELFGSTTYLFFIFKLILKNLGSQTKVAGI